MAKCQNWSPVTRRVRDEAADLNSGKCQVSDEATKLNPTIFQVSGEATKLKSNYIPGKWRSLKIEVQLYSR